MPTTISPQDLDGLLKGSSPFALIDVRETGEYNNAHIPGASLIPRRDLESQMADAVPHSATPVVLCDDDARRATLAGATLEGLGYSDVSVLDGGINRWVTQEYPTEWGVNVPSKDFGEKVEVVHHVPEIDAVELQERIDSGEGPGWRQPDGSGADPGEKGVPRQGGGRSRGGRGAGRVVRRRRAGECR